MVVGASTNRAKYGNKAVRAFLRQGYEVYPVNPRAEQVEGLPCFRSAAEPPGPIDRASVYLPPELGVQAVRDLAARGDVDEVWLNPGADDPAVVAEARRLGLNVVRACSIVAVGEVPD